MRGVYDGTVFLDWMTNHVLVVATGYSKLSLTLIKRTSNKCKLQNLNAAEIGVAFSPINFLNPQELQTHSPSAHSSA